ncbi:hypothetical protein [Escherichia phage vB-Eco-KMB36]|nr:hypothetical protein [Escherichia phage vB-Eco-KMB36]
MLAQTYLSSKKVKNIKAYYNGIEYRVICGFAGEIVADYDEDSGYIIAEFFNDGLVEFE